MFRDLYLGSGSSEGSEWSARTQTPKMQVVSEESFRLIVETIPGLIAVMTPGGEVEHVNRQVLEYFGRTIDELKQWGTSDAVHPADLPQVRAAWTHAIATGQPYEFEHRIRRCDGEYRVPIARPAAPQCGRPDRPLV